MAQHSRNRLRAPLRAAAALALGAALAGCGVKGLPLGALTPGTPPPQERPETPAPLERPRTDDQLAGFYASVESRLTASGRMRRDTRPADAPYSRDDLVANFERIALFSEYSPGAGGTMVTGETEAVLRRWTRPVRVAVLTGEGVDPAMAARDRANVAAFTRRLSRLTGVDMALRDGPETNFLVVFAASSDLEEVAGRIAGRYPAFDAGRAGLIRSAPIDRLCTAHAFPAPREPATYEAVLIVIRAEHPPLTRLSCVHEEMAQAMGLPNDSPVARPSIFNDSLEFALITEHDEILLRMLYDTRLRPGMRAEEARPLLPDVAASAMAAQSAAVAPAGPAG